MKLTAQASTDAEKMDSLSNTVALKVSTGIQQETSATCQVMLDAKAELQSLALNHCHQLTTGIQILVINIQLLSQWLHAHKFELLCLMISTMKSLT
jgi:hypothetical protein